MEKLYPPPQVKLAHSYLLGSHLLLISCVSLFADLAADTLTHLWLLLLLLLLLLLWRRRVCAFGGRGEGGRNPGACPVYRYLRWRLQGCKAVQSIACVI